jgi:hypothetical protein
VQLYRCGVSPRRGIILPVSNRPSLDFSGGNHAEKRFSCDCSLFSRQRERIRTSTG